MRTEIKFLWLIRIYNSRFNKEDGVLSDFEFLLGFQKQNQNVRNFLKELIEKNILENIDTRIINRNSFHTYKVNRKFLLEEIKHYKQHFNENVTFVESIAGLVLGLDKV